MQTLVDRKGTFNYKETAFERIMLAIMNWFQKGYRFLSQKGPLYVQLLERAK